MLEIALDVGAEDVLSNDDGVEVITAPEDYLQVKDALDDGGFVPESAELAMVAQNYSEVDVETGEKVLRLLDALEDLDDVTSVHTNADFPEALMAAE